MKRRAAKVDANQAEIVKALRGIPGCSVAITSGAGDGFPDVVAGYHGKNYLIEIKDGAKSPSRQQLTKDQIKFHFDWCGQLDVVNNVDDAIRVILGE